MSECVDNAIIHLIRRERFYAEMLNRMKKVYVTDPNRVPTAGVSVGIDGITLYINEFFAEDQTVEGLAEILKHECEHPMRGHFEREKTLEPELRKVGKNESILDRFKKADRAYLLNLAEDTSINQDLKYLPKTFRIFDKDGNPTKDEKGNDIQYTPATLQALREAFPKANIRDREAMEYYYKFLKQEYEKQGGKGEQKKDSAGNTIQSIDCHEILEESMEQIDPEFAKAIVQKIVNDSKDSLTAQQAGNLPGHLKILIDKLNRPSKNWKQELRMFHASCTTVDQEATRRRRNRRYGLLYPGRRKIQITHIVVAIDSSGSVHDKALQQFFSELHAMAESGVKITYVECDAQIQHVAAFDRNRKPVIKGRGGTMFKPVFDLVSSPKFIQEYGKPNGLIYFTDGENWENDIKPPKCKMLWALLPGCRVKYDWGRKIWIDIKEGK